MKITALVLTLVSAFALSAEAGRKVEMETILCKGREESRGVTLTLEAKSNSNVEGKAIAYYSTLTERNGNQVTGMIFGYKEDVMLNLKPKRDAAVQVSGTIYMDDAEQNLDLLDSNGKTHPLYLECGMDTL